MRNRKLLIIPLLAGLLAVTTTPGRADETPPVPTSDQEGPMIPGITKEVEAVNDSTWSLVRNAVSWLGVPYRHGGRSADKGFDCSGFVLSVYQKTFNLALPPSALLMSKVGQQIAREELRIGDLIFFNTLRRPFSHVGIYLGENRFIHACSSANQVKIDTLDQYYTKRLNGFRRISDG